MRLKLALAGWLAAVAQAPSLAADTQAPQAGRDYYAWQIASGDPQALLKLFHQYRALPYVRIERRGKHHVLRAGLWTSDASARDALAQVSPAHPMIRVATYRPDAVLRRNWDEAPAPAVQATPPMVRPAIAATTPAIPPTTQPSVAPTAPGPDTGLRTFNQEDFALAFQVFLGSGDRQRAYQVATQAVASVPGNADWRRKLARLADWTNQPLVAWEHWHYLFQQGDRSNETSNAILRLAPLAGRPEVAIAVWKVRADHAALNAAQWADLLDLFEMADEVPAASLYFEKQYRRYGNLQLLEYAAQLANNVGDDARALALYQERANTPPFSIDAMTRAALLLIRSDRVRDAFDLMQAHRHEVPAEMAEFWRTLGNTAWDLQEAAAAEAAYRTYANSPQATVGDWSRLIFLARQHSPQLGAELAMDAYRRWGRMDDLLLALGIYAQSADLAGQARAFQALTEKDLQEAQQQPRFLILRAQYYQNQRDEKAAWTDYRKALALAPDDSQVTIPSLWFLIDRGRKQELASLLSRMTPQGRQDPEYWLGFAAAHQVLDRHRDALFWYQKVVRNHPDDVLLLLSYADALNNVRRVGMADRVRRHAWLRMREKSLKWNNNVALDKQPELLAWARLQLLNQPGDASLQLVRNTVAQLRGLDAASLAGTEPIQDLVLGWALSTGQFLNARQWMWLQQARKEETGAAPPVWAASQIALQLGDAQVMNQLLEQRVSSMPVHSRYDAAYTLGHEAQALGIAFNTLQRDPNDEDMHDRYRQHAPAAASYVQYRVRNEVAGELLSSQSREVEVSLQAAPHLQLLLGWSQTGQSTSDTTLGTLLPATERLSSMGLQWQSRKSSTLLQLFERNELTTQVGASLDHTSNWSQRLVLQGGFGYRVDASDSIPLRTGGNQDYLQWGLNYAMDKRASVRLHTRWAQYQTQQGDALGEGQINDLEVGYRLRTEYPDVRVRLYATDQAYTTANNGPALLAHLPTALSTSLTAAGIDAARYFMPESSTTWGGCLDFGENLAGQSVQQTYTRAARPFMELCALNHSRSGNGYSGAIGMAGSVLGPDHLSLRMEQNEGGIGSVGGALTRAWTLRYRYYF